jgi:hypothetical protein
MCSTTATWTAISDPTGRHRKSVPPPPVSAARQPRPSPSIPRWPSSGVELINQSYDNPAYLAIMAYWANTAIGVWSENSLDRTVVVAVYGQPG